MSALNNPIEITLETEPATVKFAEDLALAIKPGDCFALSGDLGAGKTTLTRAVIRAIADEPKLEVPSPTFTLLQQYDLRIPIGHFDLYRISEPEELDELGLDDILSDGVAFIEWPENALSELPKNVIHLKISGTDERRLIDLQGHDDFVQRYQRSTLIRAFLNEKKFTNAERRFFQGDASSRSYERIRCNGQADLILMNAPKQPDGPIIRDGKTYSEIAHLAEDVVPFIAIDNFLTNIGLKAPEIVSSSIEDGILVLEDLGNGKPIDNQNVPIAERYLAAVSVQAFLHDQQIPESIKVDGADPHIIPRYDQAIMQMEIELLTDWYLPFKDGTKSSEKLKQKYLDIWRDLFALLQGTETSLTLRDFHSPNIIWREGAIGHDQVGLIDFQDALIGPSAYDVASLAQDARVTVSQELEAELLAAYKSQRLAANADFDSEQFDLAYSIMAAQRAAKVLGIFVRLNERDGKPQYLRHIPRVEQYITRAVQHSKLHPLRNWLKEAGIIKAES